MTRDGGDTHLQFLVVENPEDPCPDTIEPPLGPTYDDLVNYLVALPNMDISEIRYSTLDGHRAVYLESRPVDAYFDCMSANPQTTTDGST